MKPNCYECKHRSGVSGSAHSRCNHPSIKTSPLGEIMGILGSVGRVTPMSAESNVKVKGNPHGIKNGWFNFPFNFDPIWLENCDGYEKIEEAKE